MPNTKERIQAVVNSKDRLTPLTSTPEDFTWSFNKPITRVTEVFIDFVEIPYSFYAINSTTNVLIFDDGSASVSITPGNYTASSLALEIASQMNNNVYFTGYNVSATFSPITLKMTITATSPFKINSITSQPTSTFSPLLGFLSDSASSTSVIGDSCINIAGTNYIYIKSDYLTRPISHHTLYANDSYHDVLAVIPINVSPGDVVINNPRVSLRYAYKLSIQPTDTIDFTLYDEFDNIIDLNGLDWCMYIIFLSE